MLTTVKNIVSYIFPLRIEKCPGEVSPCLEVNLLNGKYMLDTPKVNYSYGGLHKIFDQTFYNFDLKEREIKSALILGFGAGSVASLLTEKYCAGCRITGIEIDHTVLHLARKYFNIKRFKNLELICDDGYNYVQTHNRKFDAIVVDIYIDEQVPKCFHEKRFLKQLDRLLEHNGVLFFNKVVNSSKQEEEYKVLKGNINEIFGNSLTYKLTSSGTNNNMLIHDRSSVFNGGHNEQN